MSSDTKYKLRGRGGSRKRRVTPAAEPSTAATGPPRFYVAALLGDEAAKETVRRRARQYPGWPIPRELSGNVGFLQAWMLLRNRIRRTGDESHGFAPQPVTPGQFDLHLAIMCHGADTASALKRFIGASQLLRPDFDIKSRRTRETLELSVRLRRPGDPVQDIYEEIYAVVIHCALRWVTGERVQILRARAPAAPAGVGLTFVSALGCPIARGGRGVTLIYPAAAADVPVVSVKLGRWGSVVVDQFVRELKQARHAWAPAPIQTPTTDRVRRALATQLLSEAELARRFDLSTATLRRRLAEEGTTFRDLAMAMRRQLAQTLLSTDRPIAELAAELGFSDDRSFRRACHDWFGMSPASYRARHRQDEL